MEPLERPLLKSGVVRVVLTSLAIALQIGWLALVLTGIYEWSAIVQAAVMVVSFVLVFYIFGTELNSAYKILWIVVLLALPLLGIMLYVLVGDPFGLRVLRKRFTPVEQSLEGLLTQEEADLASLDEQNVVLANQARCLLKGAGAPVFRNTDVVFYNEAVRGLDAQIKDIVEAREFIFLEYHAIEDAIALAPLKTILARKVAEGVEVRIVYDDMGSVGFINSKFVAAMKAIGVECRVFNPFVPIARAALNNRDHRKITVIDNRVGFTGGYNLGDKYFNIVHPYGLWKDVGVRLEGDAVRSLTVAFLQMWNAIEDTDKGDYARFLKPVDYRAQEGCGWVQPYTDSPLDGVLTGEDAYLNVIKGATRRLWVTTPYLIIDDEMTREFALAARRGVDVRIVTPGVPDKPLIYKVTRSHYAQLARHGVRIFEWAPGFIHAKQMLADDQVGLVGTFNLDYRSLYLHFENGVALYRCPALKTMAAGLEEVLSESREVTNLYAVEKFGPLSLSRRALRLISPLL